jgi:hypothetical protein
MRIRGSRGAAGRVAAALLGAGLAVMLAACSGSGGGGLNQINGLGADAGPSAPPTLTGTGPGGQYAFVYGNQIWLKANDPSQPHQLTHLVIPNGAYIAWGPLMWSPDGHSIAFAMLEDTSGGHPARSTGPLYLADVASGAVQTVPGTADLAGHGYAWYGPSALFYANPSGVAFDDLTTPADPRVWSVAPGQSGPTNNGGTTFYSYTDIAFSGQNLLATQLAITSPGAVGQIGQGALVRFFLGVAPGDYAGGNMNIGYNGLYGGTVSDLGQAYAGTDGVWRGGSWQAGPNNDLVVQKVTGIDLKAGTESFAVCYDAYVGNPCDQQLFGQVVAEPLASPPQFVFSPDGGTIAMTGAALATQQRDGGNFASHAPAVAGMPVWSGDGKVIAANQIVSATPDANGVIHLESNIITYTGGGKGVVAIAGAQNLSWRP